jgi:hypothetical protein
MGGITSWNKGLTKETDERVKKYSESNIGKHDWKGKKHPMYGKHHSEVSKNKMREHNWSKLGYKAPFLGKHHTEKTILKISETKIRLCREGKIIPSMLGKHHNDKTKEKISSVLSELYKTPKGKMAIENMRNLKKGKRCSVKTEFKKGHTATSGSFQKGHKFSDDIEELRIKNVVIGVMKRPTSIEKLFMHIASKYDLPYKYVGDGSFWINRKNPDFVNCNGEKICIEVANHYHHPDPWDKERIEHFRRCGWECLVFFCGNDNKFDISEEAIVNKINNLRKPILNSFNNL